MKQKKNAMKTKGGKKEGGMKKGKGKKDLHATAAVGGKEKKAEKRKKRNKHDEEDIDSDAEEVFDAQDEGNYGDVMASIKRNMGLGEKGGDGGEDGASEDGMDDDFSDLSDDGGEGEGGGVNLLDMLNKMDSKKEAEVQRSEMRPESMHLVGESEGLTMEDILAPLEGDFLTVQKDLTAIEKTKPLPGAIGDVKAARAERELNYDTAKKDITKWIPQVKQNREAPQLVFGDATDREGVTTQSLVTDFNSSNELEKELEEAIKESGMHEEVMRSNLGASGLPMDDGLRKAQESSQLARLKLLLSRNQAKAKRIKKIKSKAYHRLKRRADKKSHDKLLERLEQENPELATELKKDLEKKHANMRLQRQTNARKKWALQAARFGGKAVRETISKQANLEADEKAALRKATKGKKREDDEDEDDEDEDIDVSGDDADETVTKAKKLAMMEALGDSDEDDAGHDDGGPTTSKEKGLMGLKFMRDAVQRKRDDAKREAQKLMEDLEECEDRGGSGSDESEDDELRCGQGEESIEDNNNRDSRTGENRMTFTKAELAAASESLDAKKLTSTSGHASVRVSVPLSVPHTASKKSKKKSTKTTTTSSHTLEHGAPSGRTPSSPSRIRVIQEKGSDESEDDEKEDEDGRSSSSSSGSDVDEGEENASSRGQGVEKKNKRPSPAKEGKENKIQGNAEDVFAALDLPQACHDQIKSAFATGKQEEEFVAEQEDKHKKMQERECEDDGFLPGWGGWTGEGIAPRKRPVKKDFIPLGPKAKRVQKFDGVDTKVMKYLVEQAPHPFQSQKQYEESLRMPTGREWNTAAVHKRKVLPRVITKAGAIITPLQYAKHLPPSQRDELMDAWTSKKSVRSKARL